MKIITNKYKLFGRLDWVFAGIVLVFFFLSLWGTEANIRTSNNKDILKDMSLNDCRIVQNQDEHIIQWNWSMYAFDIACIRGQSFEVFTPSYFDIYVIEKIWYDTRLWDFIVLRHWEFRFIYWHVTTNLAVGVTLKPWEVLGKINKSWISQNYHLHIELWRLWENIKFEYIWGQWEFIAPKSYEIRYQRNLLNDKEINWLALEFISSYEGMTLVAYDDWKQWSIWYGSKSYRWEKITQEEAEKRARIVIQNIREKYKLYNHPIYKQIAITSFVYNIWSLTQKQLWLLENYYYTALWNDFKLYNKANWKVLKGLEKRREAEANLLRN